MTTTGAGAAVGKTVAAKTKIEVLIVEDNSADSELVMRTLRAGGFDVSGEVVLTPEEFRRRVRKKLPDIVLADYNLGQWRGMEALAILRAEGLDIPLILVSGALGDVTAVECIKQGATDYVLKDSLARLPQAVRRALQERQLRDDRRQVQDELAKRVKELARSNAELEQFVYVASHDLQEPLRMVASYTQLLSERYRGKLDEQADKYIWYAADGAVRMQALIHDLVDFSRVGREGTELKSTDCNELVEGALKNLGAALETTGAIVTHKILPKVMAHATQLGQVFQNLIGNAIKFHGPAVPDIQIEAERLGNEWVFSVSDNGIGIAVEHAGDIFIVFNRLHTRTEYSGNGIGLAICKKIVEQHGGRIWVESREGPGSVFKFTLPAAPAASQSAPEASPGGNTDHESHDPSLAG
jgi:signal transduction histidine kinase